MTMLSALKTRLRAVHSTSNYRKKGPIKVGTPLFTMDDVRPNDLMPIAKLLRYIIADKNITDEEFKAKFAEFATRIKMDPSKINTDRCNLKKAMCEKNVSLKQFERLFTILGLGIVDIQYTLQDNETGETKVYALSDVLLKLRDEDIKSIHTDDFPEI